MEDHDPTEFEQDVEKEPSQLKEMSLVLRARTSYGKRKGAKTTIHQQTTAVVTGADEPHQVFKKRHKFNLDRRACKASKIHSALEAHILALSHALDLARTTIEEEQKQQQKQQQQDSEPFGPHKVIVQTDSQKAADMFNEFVKLDSSSLSEVKASRGVGKMKVIVTGVHQTSHRLNAHVEVIAVLIDRTRYHKKSKSAKKAAKRARAKFEQEQNRVQEPAVGAKEFETVNFGTMELAFRPKPQS